MAAQLIGQLLGFPFLDLLDGPFFAAFGINTHPVAHGDCTFKATGVVCLEFRGLLIGQAKAKGLDGYIQHQGNVGNGITQDGQFLQIGQLLL